MNGPQRRVQQSRAASSEQRTAANHKGPSGDGGKSAATMAGQLLTTQAKPPSCNHCLGSKNHMTQWPSMDHRADVQHVTHD